MMTLVIGPNGSGKSAAAERLVHDLHADDPRGALIYVATMIPADDNGNNRVATHRRKRSGAGFLTLESPTGDIGRTHPDFVEADDLVLLEDVSNLLSNLMFAQADPGDTRHTPNADDGPASARTAPHLDADQARAIAHDRITRLRNSCRHLVAVTIGGLICSPRYDVATNEYITALDQLNDTLIHEADRVITRGGDV